MPYLPDLSEDASLLGVTATAIGWLSPSHPHIRGDVSLEFFEKLCELLVDPWQPYAVAGAHPCEFCRFTGGSGVRYKNVSVQTGIGLLIVPSDDVIYVAPTAIAHTVDAHGYKPPEVFIEAVLQCPPMRSMDYLKGLKKHGVKRWTREACS